MAKKAYDPKSATSILNHGMMLLGKSLKELHPEAEPLGGKGGLGKAVEKFHYEYEPNSEAEPDFAEAGLELKCTPLKMLNDHSMAAKERLVLNIINYMDEAQCAFSTSSFWRKNKFLLLMFYLHEAGVNPVDMLFKLIRTWQFPEEDLKIITDDWNTIHDKIRRGEAHLLTEGDTFYLAACMKGSRGNAEMREQPFSDEPAQQRAYSLKQGYINKILLDSFLDQTTQHQLTISPTRVDALRKKYASDKIVQSVSSYRPKETFEQLVERRLSPYYGKTIAEISEETHTAINLKAKSFAYKAIRAMLGIQTQRILEFENAGITVKSIALEAKEDKVKESMSFPYIRYVDIINQEWEESDCYQTLSSKFLFVVFR
ncbi:MAG: MutH/Sau3AI family endonuclease, partial [Bacteroides sp.]